MTEARKSNTKIDKILENFRNNKSFFYYIIFFIIVGGLIFFLNSNAILNKENNLMSSELNKRQNINDYVLELNGREFNTTNNLVKLHLKFKNTNPVSNNSLEFNLIERSRLNDSIPTNVIEVDDSNIVVYAIIPKKWTTLALQVTEKNTKSATKFFTDSRDITINNNLIEQKKLDLSVEIANEDINKIKKELSEFDKEISDKNSQIKNLEIGILDLQEKQKYQTEDEILESNSEIGRVKGNIEALKIDISKIEEKKVARQEKIKKIEEKRGDILKSNKK